MKTCSGPASPQSTAAYISPSATTEGITIDPPRRWMKTPIARARGICTSTGKIAAGYCLSTAAITSPKIARTIQSATIRMTRKSVRTRGPRRSPATSPTVRPLFLSETASAPRSCTAPMKIAPRTTQMIAGTQPHITAMAGPTMGPVPAIEVKWWPKTTERLVGQ